MKIAILKERRPHETRVAATPETVKKLKALGVEEIVIETGAGVVAAYTDEAYAEAGAMIVPDAVSPVLSGSCRPAPRLLARWRPTLPRCPPS